MTKDIEDGLGYRFARAELLDEALTHSSYANEIGSRVFNERLEFLGDAVLELCVSEALFLSHDDWDEGVMTDERSRLVCERSLASWAAKIGVDRSLRAGRSLDSQGGRRNASVLADAMEAIFGAIFLDGGIDAAKKVIARFVSMSEVGEGDSVHGKDAKSALQEFLQAQGLRPPTYSLVKRSGPDHASTFEVDVVMPDGVVAARGSGSSIKAAEFAAAKIALAKISDEGDR